jgi:hypothetical protein
MGGSGTQCIRNRPQIKCAIFILRTAHRRTGTPFPVEISMARPMHAAEMAPNKNLDIFQSIDLWKISDAKTFF